MGEERNEIISEYEILKQTFDAIEDPIFFLGMDGTILHANHASTTLLAMPLETILGSRCCSIVHHTPTFIRGCPFVKARETKKREIYTVNLGDRWYQVAVDPVINDQGEMIGAVHILTDINTVKKVHELRSILGAIIETTHDPIIGETVDGQVLSWNRGAEETFGYSAEEMIGESIFKIIPPNLRNEWKQTLLKVQRGERIHQIETRRIRADGEEVEIALSLSPIIDERGIITGIAVIGRNLTEARKAERALTAYITEAALRLKNPIEIITHTLEEICRLHQKGEIDDKELTTSLMIQARHARQIALNIQELQQAIIQGFDEIPDSYRRFLMNEE